MNFHLEFPIPSSKEKLNYRQSVLSIGSCFAESIGELLKKYRFNIFINPNGIIYNPASIAIALRKYLSGYNLKVDDLFYSNEVWNSWEHHSSYSFANKDIAADSINNSYSNANKYLKNGDWLFITFGSAYYYKRNETGLIIANCHKQPQKDFAKHLLSIDEIVKDYTQLLKELIEVNPKLKIVFTISPVKYIRDGVIENARSKAILLEAVHQIKEKHSNVFYFPAYEIITDDLRDYRFFKEDLVHPNEQAIKYIFERFKEIFFDQETKEIFERIKRIVSDFDHKPLHFGTKAHKEFEESRHLKAKQLTIEFPYIDMDVFLKEK